jgi:hypothetical protein
MGLDYARCGNCTFFEESLGLCIREPLPIIRVNPEVLAEAKEPGFDAAGIRGCKYHPHYEKPSTIDQILSAVPPILASQGVGGDIGSIFGGEEMPKVDDGESDGDN